MSAGLDPSTVTPGSTLPDMSRATPAMPLACCAEAVIGMNTMSTRAPARNPDVVPFMMSPGDRRTCGPGILRPNRFENRREFTEGVLDARATDASRDRLDEPRQERRERAAQSDRFELDVKPVSSFEEVRQRIRTP